MKKASKDHGSHEVSSGGEATSSSLLDELADATSLTLLDRTSRVSELLRPERREDLIAEFESSYRSRRHSMVAELLDQLDKKGSLGAHAIDRILTAALRYGPSFDVGVLMSVVNIAGRHTLDHQDRALQVLDCIVDLPGVPKSTRSTAVTLIAPHADLKTVERMLCRALHEKDEQEALSTMVARVSTGPLEMRGLSPEGFEFLVKMALLCAARSQGRMDEHYEVTGGSHDGGIDVLGRRWSEAKGAFGPTIALVQCKNVRQLKDEHITKFAADCMEWARQRMKRSDSELPGTSVESKPRKLLVAAVQKVSPVLRNEAKLHEIDLLYGDELTELVLKAVGRKIVL